MSTLGPEVSFPIWEDCTVCNTLQQLSFIPYLGHGCNNFVQVKPKEMFSEPANLLH